MNRVAIGLLIVMAGTRSVSAAPPTLEAVAPLVGQRGTEFTVVLSGGRLLEPQSLLFYQPGLTCTKLTAQSETELTATIRAAADCPLGEHAFRIVTKDGASELRSLGVTPFPVVPETDAENGTPKTAQPVKLNSTVAGRIDTGDVDCFAITLEKGQRLSAEIEAIRLGSPLDAVLTITGPDGTVLVEIDDAPPFRQDPIASIIASTAGVYVVGVRDTAYGGGDAERYALHIGSFPRPTAIFPAGGPIGRETKVSFLDTAGEQIVNPGDAAFAFYPADAAGTAPTPHPFRSSPFPNVLEGEAAAVWPVAFNGVLAKPDEIDEFRLVAKAGDRLDVAAFAFRIGSPMDPVVTVLDADGLVVASNDDDETHDSRVRFTTPKDGVYVVRVQDKRKQGGPRFVYRIEVTKPTVGLSLFLATPGRKAQDRGTITIPRGNRVSAFLAVRRDGATGPVTIQPGDLPSGVTLAGPAVVPADEYLLPVVLEASTASEPGARLCELTGRAGAAQGGFSQTATLVAGPGDLSLHDVSVSKLAVVVVDESPLRVTLDEPKAALATDGSLDVTVRLQRAGDFEDAVEISFPFLPPGVEAPASVVIPAGKSETTVTFVAQRKASIGDWPVFVEAKPAPAAATRERRDPDAPRPMGRRSRRTAGSMPPVASQIVTIRVSGPPVAGTIAPTVSEQGKTAVVRLELTGGQPPAGFTATLAGLPPRATAKPLTVPAGAKRLEFTVAIDATTPLGDHASLVCELSGLVGTQAVVYRVGRPGTLSVFPPGGVATDKDGKPLSRLEALRQEQSKKQNP